MDLAQKLQLKPGQGLESVLAPDAPTPALPTSKESGDVVSALIVFVIGRKDLALHREQIVSSARSDRLTWVSYPKSGQLGTDFNRDSVVALLGESGIQPVRQIAIDDVWSALRFRPA